MVSRHNKKQKRKTTIYKFMKKRINAIKIRCKNKHNKHKEDDNKYDTIQIFRK